MTSTFFAMNLSQTNTSVEMKFSKLSTFLNKSVSTCYFGSGRFGNMTQTQNKSSFLSTLLNKTVKTDVQYYTFGK